MGDRRGLPATVSIDEGRLRIESGEQPIGDWGLDEVHLEPIPTGYRMAAEGEQILIEMQDSTAFAVELGKSKGRTKTKRRIPKVGRSAQPKAEADPPARPPSRQSALSGLDAALSRARERFDGKLPAWMFTKIMLAIVVGALILTIVFPSLVSLFLLLSGVVVVVFGAFVYTDPIMASKWLPGSTTPVQVLIFGVAIFMFGVLLGVLAT